MNITTKNAKKVYSNTVKGMAASAAKRLKDSGYVYEAPAVKKITNLDELENAYREAFTAKEVFKYSEFRAAAKIIGNDETAKMQARLSANKS